MSTRSTSVTPSVMPLRTVFLKPSASAVIWYWPIGRFGREYCPLRSNRRSGGLRTLVDQSDLRVRDDSACRIGDRSGESTAVQLCEEIQREEKNQEGTHNQVRFTRRSEYHMSSPSVPGFTLRVAAK